MATTTPKLVVIGAGVGGGKLAKLAAASKKFEVTVIEPKDFFEIPYAAVRAVVQPGAFEDKNLIPLKDVPGGFGKLVQGKVAKVNKNSVVLESGEEIPFDYAVIATGSTHSGHGVVTPGASVATHDQRKAEFQASADAIKEAKNVVVVGGGPVGVEVVGEILEAYAGKGVTLLHSGAQLLDGKDPKMHAFFEAAIKKAGGQVVLNDKAEKWDQDKKVLTTQGGKELAADYVIWAAGSKPNTQILSGGDLEGAVDSASGRIRVDGHLRVEGAPHVFALGDVNNTPGAKLGYLADMQADLVAKVLIGLASGKQPAAGKVWKAPMEPKGVMAVSFGKGDGAMQMGGCVCAGNMFGKMKAADLFVAKVRAGWGL